MSDTIKKLTIEGFKSIRKLENFELRALNVLIGANGAGKSNFVEFFSLLRELIGQRLELTVERIGGADRLLFMGPKVTNRVLGSLRFDDGTGYEFALTPTSDGRRLIFEFEEETVVVADETVTLKSSDLEPFRRLPLGSGHSESKLRNTDWRNGSPWRPYARAVVPDYIYRRLSAVVAYHFHDTSTTAAVRRAGQVNDSEYLRSDASNLAAFLYRVRKTHPDTYSRIRDVIRLAAPFFDDFKLRPIPGNEEMIQLEWLQKDSDYPFLASQLSDGTLRFICLATALTQPTLPATMLFDEPELGLHPYALSLLGNLFTQSAKQHGDFVSQQVIVSTQSAALLNELEPEDVIVVEREQGQSTFRRLKSEELSEWLQDYSLGDLWQKNVLGGRPKNEEAEAPPETRVDPDAVRP
jgi:predicted ATPase